MEESNPITVSVSPFELKFTTYQTSVITNIAVDTALNMASLIDC